MIKMVSKWYRNGINQKKPAPNGTGPKKEKEENRIGVTALQTVEKADRRVLT